MLDPVKDIFTVTGLRALITKIVGGLATKVAKTDVVSSWQSTPDDAHVPTEKLVKETLDNLPPGTAVKGDAESEYRTGNVNLTPANIGAYSKTESDSRYKAVQNPVSDPDASGSGLSFIDSVSQDADGVISSHKKTVQDGTTAQKGVVQLNNAINSTSTTEAATPKAVKDAYDALNNKIVARAVFLSQQEWAAQSLIPGDPAKVYYVEDGTGEDAYTVYVWKESTSEYVEVDESSIDLDGYWHDGPTTTGNGNVVTGITLGNDGVPVLEKGVTALTQHQDISGKLDKADVGVANGAASLDSNGDVPLEQIPDSVKDKIVYIDGMATLNTSTGVFALTVPNTTFAKISTIVNADKKLPVLRVTVNNGSSYLKLYYKGLMSNSSDNHWHSFGSTDNQGNSPCTTGAKVFDNDEWMMIENRALNNKGNGDDVTVTPDGTSQGTDIGNSTTLKAWAQKFKNLVGALKALAFKDTAEYSDLSSRVQSSLDKADSALQSHQPVDQTYNATSTNPQSGTAVAQAVAKKLSMYDGLVVSESAGSSRWSKVADYLASNNTQAAGMWIVTYGTEFADGTNPRQDFAILSVNFRGDSTNKPVKISFNLTTFYSWDASTYAISIVTRGRTVELWARNDGSYRAIQFTQLLDGRGGSTGRWKYYYTSFTDKPVEDPSNSIYVYDAVICNSRDASWINSGTFQAAQIPTSLPAVTAGKADRLRYQNNNTIDFANVPTTGDKHRSWFNCYDGDTNQANPSNPIKSYWFGDRNGKTENTKLVTGGITNKTFIGSSSSVTWNSSDGTGFGCCCIKFSYDINAGKTRTVVIRLLIDCNKPNGDMCYVDLMFKVRPNDWNTFAIAVGRFDTSTNFNLGRIYYHRANNVYYFAVETGSASSKVTPIIIGIDNESDSDFSTLNVEFGDFNLELASSDWVQQSTKRVVYRDMSGTTIGNSTTPVYVDTDGSMKACGFQINFGTPIAGTNVLNIVT